MPWFRVDDNFYDHPKVDELSLDAVGLWTLCGTYSAKQLTDGFIPARRALKMGGTERSVRELIDAGLWLTVEGGFQFHDWDTYQPTRDKVERDREAARERQAKKRRNELGQYSEPLQVESKRSHAVTSRELPLESLPKSHHPDPALPDPTLEKTCAPATPIRETPKATAAEFDRWYSDYPRKRGKEAARKAFAKARKRASMDELTGGLEKFIHANRHKEQDFLPYPATWLNAGQWEDDYSASPSQEDYAWKIG